MAVENTSQELIINLIKVIVLVFIIRFLWSILYVNHLMPILVKRRKKKRR